MEEKRVAVSEDCVEPELLSPGSSAPRGGPHHTAGAPHHKPSFASRLKGLLAACLALLGMGFMISGALLTSTIIGAIIGIPLLILGAVSFFLLFKLLSAGSVPPVIFRRF